jgi:hypothetical protein
MAPATRIPFRRPNLRRFGLIGKPEPTAGRVRDVATGLELPESPHPTPLRGATFSHKWEKGAAAGVFAIQKSKGASFSRLREKVARRSRVG